MKNFNSFVLLLLLYIFSLPLSVLADTERMPCKRNDNAAGVLQGTNLKDAPCATTAEGELFIQRIEEAMPTVVPAQITPSVVVNIAATAVPTAFPTPQATIANAKFMQVCNMTNQTCTGAYGGATAEHFRIAPGGCYWRNWGASNSTYTGPVSIARPSTLPTTGEVTIWFEK